MALQAQCWHVFFLSDWALQQCVSRVKHVRERERSRHLLLASSSATAVLALQLTCSWLHVCCGAPEQATPSLPHEHTCSSA
jgi:hypothetical protein